MIALKNDIQKEKAKPILIFDTNIFLIGIDFNLIDAHIYTTPGIIEEIRHNKYIDKNRNILSRIDVALENRSLLLRNPSDESIQKVEFASKTTGDYNALSVVDKELIALALELKEKFTEMITLYTNDYSIQNVCSELSIPFSPLIREGIKSKIIWEVYCPFCKDIKNYEDFGKSCERCGTKLKRKRKSEVDL
jgi:UPF0271 protein